MNRVLFVLTIMSALFLCQNGYAKQNKLTGYEKATIVTVVKHVTATTYVGDSPTDAPLQADDHSYDIGVNLNCSLYVGRYQSAIDYLPVEFAPNHQIDVRLTKHVMYVSLPADREVKLGIVSHKRLDEKNCLTGVSARQQAPASTNTLALSR